MGKSSKGGRSAAEETESAAGEASGNGVVLFETMDDDFTIPTKLGVSQWDGMVKRVLETERGPKGFPIIKIYQDDADHIQRVYTRAKQLKLAATRLEADITVAVRKMPGDGTSMPIHAVLAQRNK